MLAVSPLHDFVRPLESIVDEALARQAQTRATVDQIFSRTSDAAIAVKVEPKT